ncbi:hypothetical protein HY311_01750 [Candidatus Nomurabacteria bacterium]|nr:hypothetical protein [Candidatus Nomurabacteria bacterium]
MKKQNLFLRKSIVSFAVFFVVSFLSFSHFVSANIISSQTDDTTALVQNGNYYMQNHFLGTGISGSPGYLALRINPHGSYSCFAVDLWSFNDSSGNSGIPYQANYPSGITTCLNGETVPTTFYVDLHGYVNYYDSVTPLVFDPLKFYTINLARHSGDYITQIDILGNSSLDTYIYSNSAGIANGKDMAFVLTDSVSSTCSDGIQNQDETGIDIGGICGMKAITSFNFQGLTPSVTGVVNETNHSINLTVPHSTDVSALVPTIAISSGASVSPNTNTAQNFSSPVVYIVTATDGSTQEYIVTVTPSCTVDCFSNVLFLPGIEASRLYKSETIADMTAEYKFWEPSSNSDVENLYLNTNGSSIDPNIYTRDIIGTTNVLSVSGPDVYKSLIAELNNLKSTNKISDWEPFAYDWRQGVNDLVQNGTKYNDGQILTLIGTLQHLINTSKTGKVTIITHSNGGLLAKALIKKLEDMKSAGQSDLVDHIDNLIMVAVPQLGTPEALSGLLHGYNQDLSYYFLTFMDKIHARKLAQNMASAYGLLPSQKYFDLPGINYPAVFDPSEQIYTTAYGPSIDSYQEEHNFLLGQEGRTQPVDSDLISPAIGNSVLLTQAENLHNSIDNMTFPSSINVINIAGWGRSTIVGMTYIADDLQPITSIRGDETVVSQSAIYGQGTKYWLDLSQSTLDHGHIFEDPQLLSFIDNVVEQKSSTLSNITDTEPLQSDIILVQSVHSPVSLGVYDTQGNFTGKVCDDVTGNCVIKEGIPGSTYLEFGEGKYVNLSQNKIQKTVLQGTDIGTFTFNSQAIAPSGQTTTSSFVNIPVTTQTQAEITLNQTTGTPQLALDVTGDGVTDFTIAPSANFDPVIYLQIMKATIDSLDLTQAKIKAFDKRIDNIIKSIQKGKIDKAKLKVDKFKSVLENKLAKPDPKHLKPKKLSKIDAQLLLDMLNKLLDNLN